MVIEKDIRAHDFLRGGPKWRIILGSKGNDSLAGFIWANYIINVDPIDIGEFHPRLDIVSRYTTKMVDNRYYSTMTL